MIQTECHWRERILELQALLEEVKPLLVAEEAQLSEQLAAISAFEFRVRYRLEILIQRLEKLTEEIQILRRRLNNLREDCLPNGEFINDTLYEQWLITEDEGTVASGNFRYREAPKLDPAPSLTPDQNVAVKQLYRKLARRFHPDFALDDEDRIYRTNMMMAINAAYAKSDLERLEELTLEPDPQQREYTNQQLAEALLKEWHHCWCRMKEIELELARLEEHPSTQLMRQADKIALKNRDLLDELAAELRDKIAHKMIRLDILKDEIESFVKGHTDFGGDDFADVVFDLGLEQILVEDPDSTFIGWREKYWKRCDFDDGSDESAWEELRKQRNQKRR